MQNLEFAQNEVCEACQKGKMKKSSHKSKTVNSISAPLQLIHMDLFGPVNVLSISRKKYALVMMDDYSRYTWVEFMHSKDETPHIIIEHVKKIEKQAKDQNFVKRLRSDNGIKFRNATLTEFCKDKGIVQEFSAARTPQQNGVVERKNRTLVEASRTMMQDAKFPTSFWEEAVNTTCYTQNINKIFGKSPYSILYKRKPTVKHLHVFGRGERGEIFASHANDEEDAKNSSQQTHTRKWDRSHTGEEIIGDPNTGVRNRSATVKECLHAYFLSQVEPKKTEEVLLNSDWISAIQEVLNQFERKKVWKLVPAPKNIKFLLKHGFTRGTFDKTLFYKQHGGDMILVQIYVDDIIFGSTNEKLCQRFSKFMQSEYEMSTMGELSYFFGIQVSQRNDEIFISQTNRPDIMFAIFLCARFQANPKESHLMAVKRISRYLKGTPNLGLWYPKRKGFEAVRYTDVNFVGCWVDRKSTSGSCQFLGQRFGFWYRKK
ncbi:hypothetical protein AgCh_012312 [Apium graveolens]